MAAKIRNFVERNGRYYARLVIPKELQKAYGKTEDRIPLGGDYREAVKKHHVAMATLHERLAMAKKFSVGIVQSNDGSARRYFSPAEIAASNYKILVDFDDELRRTDSRYVNSGPIDDLQVRQLRDGIAGRLTDLQLQTLIGYRIEAFQAQGYVNVSFGTPEWRELAIALCRSQYEFMARVVERDEGDYRGEVTDPFMKAALSQPEPAKPVSIKGLFADYIKSKKAIGKGLESERRWNSVIANLVSFIGHDDANKLTELDLINWRDKLLEALAPKTVADVYLVAVRTLLNWAVSNRRIGSNPAEKVRQEVPKKQHNRERGFTLPEAIRILKATLFYEPKQTDGRIHEFPETTAAIRFSSILCAFTGARIAEITQLRKSDIRRESTGYVLRLSPGAGTLKSGHYRDIPLHQQVIDSGFLEFVKNAPDGPLFYRAKNDRDPIKSARVVSGRISEWLNKQELVPQGLDPNHAWRHRFKTVGREVEIADRVLDALTGHSSKTVGDSYGDVSLKTRMNAISKFPSYDLSGGNKPEEM